VDRVGEKLREPGVDRVDVGVGAAFILERRGPGADVGRPHCRQRYRPEVRLDDLDVNLGLPHGRLAPSAVAGQPLVAPLPHFELRVLRCDVVTAQQRSELLVDPLLPVDLSIEGTRVLVSGVVDIPSAPAGHLARDGRRHLDGVAVLVLDPFAPTVLDSSALGSWLPRHRPGLLAHLSAVALIAVRGHDDRRACGGIRPRRDLWTHAAHRASP
jgi:hypothetical protein